MILRLRQWAFGAFLVLSVPFLGTVYAASGPATIIDLTNGCDPVHPAAQRNNLHAALVAAGYTVTDITTGVVPADLAGQQQVWDLRCQTVLTAPEITTFTSYLTSGGSLFLMGENIFYGAARDPSLIAFLSALGAGSLTLTATATAPDSQTVQPPFTGPDPVTTVVFRAPGGTTTPGTGSFITKDSSNHGGAVVFGPGSLSAAPNGSLIIVWDVNFLDSERTAGETALANNLVAYLAEPTPINPPTPRAPVPTLSEWGMILLCGLLGLAAVFALRRKRA